MVKMSKEEVKAILGKVVLAFQICLGLWQFLKLTPLGALLQGVVGCLLRPLGLSPSYTRLQSLQGRLFKRVPYFFVFERSHTPPVRNQCEDDEIRLSYLGADFHLVRRGTDKNMLFVNGKMCYYITQLIWNELAFTTYFLAYVSPNAEVPNVVFLENYKEIWEHVATGRDMTFEQVLDHIILDCHTLRQIEGSSMLLPVDLSVSEERVLKMLNLAGFFLQTKKVYWLIPLLLSFTSTVLEFSTPLRKWIYEKINALFCCAMHVICDPLPRSMRSQIYGLGKLVDNLKPTNDIKLKVTKGNITATIAGGAKVHTEGALTLVPTFALEEAATEATFHYDNIEIQCRFDAAKNGFFIRATTFDDISVGCGTRSQFLSILTLVWSMANNGSGSLKSYGPHRKVCVRGLKETVYSYVVNDCPNVYEMELENVVVN